jgi:UDP-N-acetylglucosamine 4,6-dehydratase
LSDGVTEFPITDVRMTRFWLQLKQAAEMVLTAVERMRGGELYVKKIPSIKIIDLARAIFPDAKIKEVGIRPGEKIHEQMITKEDARNTLEFKDYFVVLPAFGRHYVDNFHLNCSPVKEDFEYSSDRNSWWLTIEEIKKLIEGI